MSDVLKVLTQRLAPPLQAMIKERVEAMMRQIVYLDDKRDPHLEMVKRHGWSKEHLEVICSLNSFYQFVIGPLASSARYTRTGLGGATPILYGDRIVFDAARARKLQVVEAAFMALVGDSRLDERLLYANHADDLVYNLAKIVAEHDDHE